MLISLCFFFLFFCCFSFWQAVHTGMRAYIYNKNSVIGSQAEHSGMRTYYFSADTQEDMNSWIRAMNQAALMQTRSSLRRQVPYTNSQLKKQTGWWWFLKVKLVHFCYETYSNLKEMVLCNLLSAPACSCCKSASQQQINCMSPFDGMDFFSMYVFLGNWSCNCLWEKFIHIQQTNGSCKEGK